MDAHRPRHSVLSLFDPLSGSPNSLLDKENNVGDSSFFHPYGSNARTPIQPTFRRRLIDIGDMTVDEPDMHDLLAEDDDDFEHELNCSLAAGDDDNDTLTFRDMAKAATPKWSGRHYTSLTTPKSSPTPRTPLAEISFKDETTPVARKRPYRRQILTVASKVAEVDYAEVLAEEMFPPTTPAHLNTPEPSTSPLRSTPTIEISLDGSQQHSTHEILNHSADALGSSVCTLNSSPATGPLIADTSIPHGTPEASNHSAEALGSSVCTLNLLPASGALIADTSIPVSISPSSPRSSPQIPVSPPTNTQARLRPNLHSTDHLNRHSVDLQSSFQLHLSSSDATFNLLNEKISFFNSKDGNSFLNNIELDGSFGEDDFGIVKDIPLKGRAVEKVATSPKPAEKGSSSDKGHTFTTEGRALSPCDEGKPVFIHDIPSSKVSKVEAITDRERVSVKRSTSASSSTPSRKDLKAKHAESPRGLPTSTSINAISSGFTKNMNLLSTPSSSSGLQFPPRVIPALKIVKRSKLVSNAHSNPSTTTTHSRRPSIAAAAPPPLSRNQPRSHPSKVTATINENKQVDALPPARGLRRTVPAQPIIGAPTPVDGPRRVLISEGPKLNPAPNTKASAYLDQAKSLSTKGPRRIVVAAPSAGKPAPAPVARPPAQSSSGLKQPAKYATVGPVSAIPKPIARAAGSNLPGPPSSKARFGVPTTGMGKGLSGR